MHIASSQCNFARSCREDILGIHRTLYFSLISTQRLGFSLILTCIFKELPSSFTSSVGIAALQSRWPATFKFALGRWEKGFTSVVVTFAYLVASSSGQESMRLGEGAGFIYHQANSVQGCSLSTGELCIVSTGRAGVRVHLASSLITLRYGRELWAPS